MAPAAAVLSVLFALSCGSASGYNPILCDFEEGRWYKVAGPISSFDIQYEFGKGYRVFDFQLEIPEDDGARVLPLPGECYADSMTGRFSLDSSMPDSGAPVRIEGRFIAFADCVGSLECEGIVRTWTVRSKK